KIIPARATTTPRRAVEVAIGVDNVEGGNIHLANRVCLLHETQSTAQSGNIGSRNISRSSTGIFAGVVHTEAVDDEWSNRSKLQSVLKCCAGIARLVGMECIEDSHSERHLSVAGRTWDEKIQGIVSIAALNGCIP